MIGTNITVGIGWNWLSAYNIVIIRITDTFEIASRGWQEWRTMPVLSDGICQLDLGLRGLLSGAWREAKQRHLLGD